MRTPYISERTRHHPQVSDLCGYLVTTSAPLNALGACSPRKGISPTFALVFGKWHHACGGKANLPQCLAGGKEERPMSIRDRIMAADGQWLMGRVMPRDLLQGIGKYLHRVAPEREDELIAAIKNRAEELIEANEDMVVDRPAEGMLGISAVVLAAFEMPLERLDPGTFEMRVERCFFHDFFSRHDARLVTTVLCAWDANTLGGIDPAVSGLRAERTSLLSRRRLPVPSPKDRRSLGQLRGRARSAVHRRAGIQLRASLLSERPRTGRWMRRASESPIEIL